MNALDAVKGAPFVVRVFRPDVMNFVVRGFSPGVMRMTNPRRTYEVLTTLQF